MKRYGLIGYPLSHSFSERYFREKFKKEAIQDCDYIAFPIKSLSELQELLSDRSLCGLNVTIPYKEQVMEFLDKLDPTAAEISAVNTIKIVRDGENTTLIGYNTDTVGFRSSLLNNQAFNHGPALVLGTGGASKAVVYSLEKLGVKVTRVSRRPSGQDLSYKDLSPAKMKEIHLIVNTTPLGTYPDINTYPDIPYHLLDRQHLLYDLVYNPPETRFLKLGKAAGAFTVNGYEMLIGQAEEAWRIWNE